MGKYIYATAYNGAHTVHLVSQLRLRLDFFKDIGFNLLLF